MGKIETSEVKVEAEQVMESKPVGSSIAADQGDGGIEVDSKDFTESANVEAREECAEDNVNKKEAEETNEKVQQDAVSEKEVEQIAEPKKDILLEKAVEPVKEVEEVVEPGKEVEEAL